MLDLPDKLAKLRAELDASDKRALEFGELRHWLIVRRTKQLRAAIAVVEAWPERQHGLRSAGVLSAPEYCPARIDSRERCGCGADIANAKRATLLAAFAATLEV